MSNVQQVSFSLRLMLRRLGIQSATYSDGDLAFEVGRMIDSIKDLKGSATW